MDEARKQKAAAALQAKGALRACARCGRQDFEIVGETAVNLQAKSEGNYEIGGPAARAILVACRHCGDMSHHHVGVLNL